MRKESQFLQGARLAPGGLSASSRFAAGACSRPFPILVVTMAYRIETDSMGEIAVPADRYWGAQTQRSLEHFPIGPAGSMPIEIVRAFGALKKAAALANLEHGLLSGAKAEAIAAVCDEILAGDLDAHFPLVVWQTGSGTQTNMNCNEVVANRAQVRDGGQLGAGPRLLHPNDDVNKSQSSNDTFPTAMHLAAYRTVVERTMPAVTRLRGALAVQVGAMADIVKIGRTHWMDATPLTLGQEFSGYVAQLDAGLLALDHTLPALAQLALGGTAVGTGLNAPVGFDVTVARHLARLTGHPFVTAPNKFAALAAHDAIVETHGALKRLAVALTKIANDLRLLGSGPRCGIGELNLPANEPGSSIMPGKVNPTQVEALTMVCARVMGNDTTITFAGASGQFELNVYKPVMIDAFLQSANLLADACGAFTDHCVVGLRPNRPQIAAHLRNSLMLVTALNPHLGYEKAAQVAKRAHADGSTLREAAVALGLLTAAEFDAWVDPTKMVGPLATSTTANGSS